MSHQHVQEQIELIAKHEQDFFDSRTLSERAGDAIASFAGSLTFVILHLLFFSLWILINVAPTLKSWHFDPYPFAMLDTVVALEAILLASFILMRQSRLSRRADEREHLMLQVLMLTEKETTALLQVNLEIAEKLGLKAVARDQDINALSEETRIDEVAENIKENLQMDSQVF